MTSGTRSHMPGANLQTQPPAPHSVLKMLGATIGYRYFATDSKLMSTCNSMVCCDIRGIHERESPFCERPRMHLVFVTTRTSLGPYILILTRGSGSLLGRYVLAPCGAPPIALRLRVPPSHRQSSCRAWRSGSGTIRRDHRAEPAAIP